MSWSRKTSVVQEDIGFIMQSCLAELLQLAGTTVLVTGASGFVGSYLVETILAFNAAHPAQSCRLLLPTRSVTQTRRKWPHFFGQEHLVWFEWDGESLFPPDDVCDYVIHAASPADPADYMQDPFATMRAIASATDAVVQFSRKAQVKSLLYISSGAVYGPQPAELAAIPETYCGAPDLTDKRACYGEAKRYSEHLCLISGIPTVVGRLFTFVGPYLDQASSFAVADFIKQAKATGCIRLQSDGSALRTYCYASDLTVALWKLLLCGTSGQIYNVGSAQPTISILELAHMIAGMMEGVTVEVLNNVPVSNQNRSRYIPDTTRLNALYTPHVAVATGVARTLQSWNIQECSA